MQKILNKPSPELSPYISHYYYIEANIKMQNASGSFPYNGPVVVFNLNDDFLEFKINERGYKYKNNMSGILEKASTVSETKNEKCLCIFFKPMGVYRLFGVPQSLINNQFICFEEFFGQSSREFIEELLEKKNLDHRIQHIENFIHSRKTQNTPNLECYQQAIRLMQQAQGNIKIKNLCNYLNISQRTFERNFKKNIGITPKSFNRIERLNFIFKNLTTPGNEVDLQDVIYHLGYYDQSHFIHDLKKYCGDTPTCFDDKKFDLCKLYFEK